MPAAFEVRSEKAAVAADGWLLLPKSSASSLRSSESGATRRPRKKKKQESAARARTPVFVLRKPAAARATLTPPLVKHCLSRLSPLLADAVAVSGGSAEEGAPALAATLCPDNGVLFPRFSRGVLRVEPLLVELMKSKGGTGIASRALGWLDTAAAAASVVSAVCGGGGSGGDGGNGGSGDNGGGGRRRFPFGGGGSSSFSSSPLAAALNSSPSLVAWTSPAELDLRVSKRGGGVTVGVRRVDVLVGPPEKTKRKRSDPSSSSSSSVVVLPDRSRSARFATWGTVDAAGRRLALTLGIPAETLKRAAGGGGSVGGGEFPSPSGKLSNVPDDAMLCLDIRGSLEAPRVDFAGATQRLAELYALSSAAKASSSSSSSPSDAASSSSSSFLGSHPLSEKDLSSPSSSSSSSSSFVSPALAAVKKLFWKKAAERARGKGVAAEPRSAPGSGGSAVPRSGCEAFPWEELEEEGNGKRKSRRRGLGQIEAVLQRQERQRRREAVFDER